MKCICTREAIFCHQKQKTKCSSVDAGKTDFLLFSVFFSFFFCSFTFIKCRNARLQPFFAKPIVKTSPFCWKERKEKRQWVTYLQSHWPHSPSFSLYFFFVWCSTQVNLSWTKNGRCDMTMRKGRQVCHFFLVQKNPVMLDTKCRWDTQPQRIAYN